MCWNLKQYVKVNVCIENILAVIFRDKFWPKFQQEFSPKFQKEFSPKFQQGFLPKFQNFGSNLNKIFYKILLNLNILPIIFAEVLLSLFQYYNKNPVRNLVSISAILLLNYWYTFSYRSNSAMVCVSYTKIIYRLVVQSHFFRHGRSEL